MGSATVNTQLENYLLANTTNETWILAVPNSQSGADLIIQTGKPVMAIGGFSGQRPDPEPDLAYQPYPGRKSPVFPHRRHGRRGHRRRDERGQQRNLCLGEHPLHPGRPVNSKRDGNKPGGHCCTGGPYLDHPL